MVSWQHPLVLFARFNSDSITVPRQYIPGPALLSFLSTLRVEPPQLVATTVKVVPQLSQGSSRAIVCPQLRVPTVLILVAQIALSLALPRTHCTPLLIRADRESTQQASLLGKRKLDIYLLFLHSCFLRASVIPPRLEWSWKARSHSHAKLLLEEIRIALSSIFLEIRGLPIHPVNTLFPWVTPSLPVPPSKSPAQRLRVLSRAILKRPLVVGLGITEELSPTVQALGQRCSRNTLNRPTCIKVAALATTDVRKVLHSLQFSNRVVSQWVFAIPIVLKVIALLRTSSSGTSRSCYSELSTVVGMAILKSTDIEFFSLVIPSKWVIIPEVATILAVITLFANELPTVPTTTGLLDRPSWTSLTTTLGRLLLSGPLLDIVSFVVILLEWTRCTPSQGE